MTFAFPMWTLSQRAVLLAFVFGLFVYLSLRLAIDRRHIPDPQPPAGVAAGRLADRIDPNTATPGMIAALPNVGEKLARAIVAYREAFAKSHPGRPAFLQPDDLLHVRGIGPAKVESMQAYLTFPATSTTHGTP